MTQNHYDSRDALFRSSEYLANILARCAFIERNFYHKGSYCDNDSERRHRLENAIIQVYSATLLYTVEVRSAQNLSKREKAMDWVTSMTGQSLTDLQSSISREEQNLKLTLDLEQHLERREEARVILARVDEVLSDLRALLDDFTLGKLNSLETACFDAYQENDDLMAEFEGRCLPGTRIELVEEVTEWATCLDGKRVFLLNGMAGTGKSTVSRTIAKSFDNIGILGASFFFQRNAGDRGNAKRLFSTIARQLVRIIPQMIHGIRTAVIEDPGISEKSVEKQFKELLLQPLLGLEQSNRRARPIVVVIDALDECEQTIDIEKVLKLLPQVTQVESIRLQFFLTSRPELSTYLGFGKIEERNRRSMVLHEVIRPTIERDISLFLTYQFREIQERRHELRQRDWPGKDTLQDLVAISVPLFIFAATVCRFVGQRGFSPQKRLVDLLQDPATNSGSVMARIYLPILKQPLKGLANEDVKNFMQQFHDVLGVIIILADSLSISTLTQVCDIEEDVMRNTLEPFRSVLSVPDDSNVPVKTLHLSFRDFLLETKTSFHVDGEEVHKKLVFQCFRIMNSLKQNICDLPSYGTYRGTIRSETINQRLLPDLQYSCRYWAHHLEQSKEGKTYENDVLSFLEKHLLHWLEAMSLMGVAAESVGILDTLLSIFRVSLGRTDYMMTYIYRI